MKETIYFFRNTYSQEIQLSLLYCVIKFIQIVKTPNASQNVHLLLFMQMYVFLNVTSKKT